MYPATEKATMLAPLSAIASILLLTTSATTLALPAEQHSANTPTLHARQDESYPINVNNACKHFYGSSFSAQTKGNGCNDWVCRSGNTGYGVDLTKWCLLNYADGVCIVDASCSNGVNSWQCNYHECE